MKKGKIVFSIFCIFLYVILTLMFIRNQKPNIENISHHLEMGNDNTFYVAENNNHLGVIYQLDKNGEILKVYQRGNNSFQNKEIIKDLCFEDNVYFLAESGKGVNHETYEVFKLSDDWKEVSSLGVLEKEITFDISNFTVSNGKIYITGIDKVKKEQIVYGLDLKKEGAVFEVELVQKYPTKSNGSNAHIVENYFDGNNLYTLTNQGMLYRYQKNSALGEYMKDAGTLSWIFDSHNGVISYKQETNSILHINQDIIKTIDENPEKGIIDMTVSLFTGDKAAIYRDSNLKKSIYCNIQEQDYIIKKFHYNNKIMFQLYSLGIVFLTGSMLIFYLSVMLIFWLLKKLKKTALTLAVLTFFLNVSFIASVCAWNYLISRNSLYENRAISTNVYLQEEMERLKDKVLIEELDFENFSQSEWFSLSDDSLWDWVISDYQGNEILFGLELIELSEKSNKILVSKQNTYGRDISGIYAKTLLEFIQMQGDKNFSDRKKAFFEDREYMYVLMRENRNFMWIGRAEIRDIPERIKNVWLQSVEAGLIFGSITSILFMFLIFWLLKPLKKMSNAMEKVSLGIYDLPKDKYPDNEFGDMWRYLHKMCNALQVREYSSDNVLAYYQRFAPQNFEDLLGAESIQDVRIGDRNKVKGVIALVSIFNPSQLHKEEKRNAFLNSVDKIIKEIQSEENNKEGVLLSEGYQFTSFRKLFPGTDAMDKAYQFTVSLMHDLYSLKEEENVINPFIILHYDTFLCGLMGTESMVCPYIVSESTEVLTSFSEEFENLGVRLLLTQEAAEKLTDKPVLRFIGHLSKGNRGYHLYEVLNVCPKYEMLLKVNYNGLFQQGMQLYLNNQFYQARGCFSELVKVCPIDGVAKWYLFACDSIMEKGLSEIPSHNLFETY